MSIPPAVGYGVGVTAALGVAKLTAEAAARFAESSTEAVSNFAEIFGADAEASKATDPTGNATGKSTNKTLREVVEDLMSQLGLTSDSPVELRLDPQGRIQVTTANPESSSAADATARMRLQSVINQNDELRASLASYFDHD